MKKMYFIVLLFFVLHSHAAEQSFVAVVSYMTVGSDYARIKLANMKSAENCPEQDFYILNLSNGQNTQMYSALLSAKIASAEVTLQLSGCYMNKPNIVHVYLE